jgi:GTPase SAR1 family protein
MKVIVLGDSGVGKSFWINSLLGVNNQTKPTLGVEVFNYTYNGRNITLWDTGANGLRGGYFLGAKCAIIIYKDKSSVDKYKQEILETTGKKLPYIAFNVDEIETPDAPLARLFKN